MKEKDRVQLSEEQGTDSYSFCIDLEGLQLSEVENPKWIQATKIGIFQHPIYGKLDFTITALKGYESNFKAGIRGQDLPIDFGHEAFRDDAAGWVKDVQVRTTEPDSNHNGLWLLVEWTKEGLKQLASKSYRYFSADYNPIWRDPSGKVHKYVLNGGGLTNRPYLKGMKPVSLSELNTSERNTMNREALEALAKSLGVEFDESTTDEALQELVAATAIEAASDSDDSDTEEDDSEGNDTNENDPVGELVGQLSEADKTNPLIRQLLADRAETAKRIKALEVANRLSETNRQLSDLRSNDAIKLGLTPKAEGKLKAIMLSVEPTMASSVIGLVKEILVDGTRQLGELGTNGKKDKAPATGDIGSDFEDAVQKLRESDKTLAYVDAVTRVSESDPELYHAYLASFGGDK